MDQFTKAVNIHTSGEAVAGVISEGVIVAVGGGGATRGQTTEASQWVEGWKSLMFTNGAGDAVEAWVLG